MAHNLLEMPLYNFIVAGYNIPACSKAMGKKTPQEIDDRIRSLWYLGRSRQDMGSETGASAGHIAQVVKEEEQLVGEGNVNALRRLSKAVGKSKATSVDVMRHVHFANACTDLDLDLEDVVDNLPKVVEACRKAKITLQQLPLDIKERTAKYGELERKIKDSEKATQAADRRRVEAESKEKHSKEERENFNKAMTWLEERDLSFEDPEKLENAFRNAERDGFDGKALANKVSSIDFLEVQIMTLEGRNKQLEKQVEENEKKIREQESHKTIYSGLLDQATELDRMGFNANALRNISDVVQRVALQNNMDVPLAIDKFINDMLTRYEPLAGFDSAILAKQGEKASLETAVENLKTQIAKHNRAAQSLIILHENGVTDADIVAVQSLAENEGSSLQELGNKISAYGSFDKALHEGKEQVKILEESKLTLEQEVSQLEVRKSSLELFLQRADGTVKTQVESMMSATKDESAKIIKISADARASISRAMEAMLQDIQAIGEEAAVVTKRYASAQGVLVFEPLIRSSKGELVDLAQVRESGLLAMNVLLASLPSDSDGRYGLEATIKNIRDDPSLGLL